MWNAVAIVGAALSFGPAHGTFTISQARSVDARYEQSLQGHVGACGWRNSREVVCVVNYEGVRPIDGAPAENLRALDLITRSGPCSNAGRVVSRHRGVTVQNGGHHYGNCFTGPLVAASISNSIETVG